MTTQVIFLEYLKKSTDAAQNITGMNAANKDVFLTKVRPFIVPFFGLYW